MEVFLDDIRIEDIPAPTGTLADLLRFVQDQRCSPEHVVVGLRCDGLDVMGDAMTEALDKPVDAVSRLEIMTGSQEGLVVDAMIQAASALTDTEQELRHIAQRLTEGNVAAGAADLADCVKVWRQIHDAIAHSLAMLKIDIDAFRVGDRPLIEALAKPGKLLNEVKHALTTQDYVMLADLFEYEFAMVAAEWHLILDAIADQARGRQTAEESAT